MDEDIFEYMDELDGEVTVFDGAYKTCEMAEEEAKAAWIKAAGISQGKEGSEKKKK